MESSRALSDIKKFALASLVIFLFAPRVFADGVNVTLTGPLSITVPEDGVIHGPFTYTLTNNSGGPIVIGGTGIAPQRCSPVIIPMPRTLNGVSSVVRLAFTCFHLQMA
jgi:hypothetical protein